MNTHSNKEDNLEVAPGTQLSILGIQHIAGGLILQPAMFALKAIKLAQIVGKVFVFSKIAPRL